MPVRTDAIVGNKIIDGSKCISYATIELKDAIPDTFKEHIEDWMFGCDICQVVCPGIGFQRPIRTQIFTSRKITHYATQRLDGTDARSI